MDSLRGLMTAFVAPDHERLRFQHCPAV